VKRYRWLIALLAVVLLAASCGRDEEEPVAQNDTETETDDGGGGGEGPDCESEAPEATEIGVSADEITVQVMADVGSPLAPGLFQGNVDAMNAFAEYVNANGGIACRDLVVETWDTKLLAEESKNGLISACTNAVALVGSNSLFNPDVSPMSGCKDKAGEATGLPDIAALANDINQQCNETTFIIQAVAEPCDKLTGERTLKAFVGPTRYYLEQGGGELNGMFLVPGDLPTTVQSATYQIKAMEEQGVKWDATLKASGRDPQAGYTPKVQELKANGSNYVYNGSNDRTMTNMMKETKAQGYDGVEVWACSLACYTRQMLTGGADVEGTYVWMQFVPFEEADANEAAKAYVDSVGMDKVDSFGAQAWQAGMLFKEVIDEIVESDGVNGITRAKILEVLNAKDDFTASGWMGDKGKDLSGMSSCMVILQIEGGEFVRRFPEEEGTLDCDDSNIVEVTLDPAVAAATIK
jgi:hypothetical protein